MLEEKEVEVISNMIHGIIPKEDEKKSESLSYMK